MEQQRDTVKQRFVKNISKYFEEMCGLKIVWDASRTQATLFAEDKRFALIEIKSEEEVQVMANIPLKNGKGIIFSTAYAGFHSRTIEEMYIDLVRFMYAPDLQHTKTTTMLED